MLSRAVPDLIRRQLARDVDAFLEDHGYTRDAVGSWCCTRPGEGARGDRGCTRAEERRAEGVMGLLASRGEHVVGVGAGSARGCDEEPATGARDDWDTGGHGGRGFVRSSYFSSGEVRSLSQPTDVLVIGGGPAGLAAALAVRQRGMSVIVADSCAPPIDKPCGEGLMERPRWKQSFQQAERWGCGARASLEHGQAGRSESVQFLWKAVVTGLQKERADQWETGASTVGNWGGRKRISVAALGRTCLPCEAGSRVCLPQALSCRAMARFYGVALGAGMSALYNSRGQGRKSAWC